MPKRLQASKQNIPHFYETVDCDVEELTKLRARLWEGIADLPGVRLNSPLEASLAGLLNVSFTGIEGEFVPVEETVESFEAIASGELDDIPEQAFFNVGGVESVLAKAKSLEEGN